VITVRVEFDQQVNKPVLMPSVTLLQDWITANYHYQLQEAWHISLLFDTTGPDTESAGPSDIKLLNWPGPVFVDRSNSGSGSSSLLYRLQIRRVHGSSLQ